MPFWRQPAPVTICPGFHLRGGEQVKIRVVGPNGSEYEITGTISVIMGRQCEDDDQATVETIVLREDPPLIADR